MSSHFTLEYMHTQVHRDDVWLMNRMGLMVSWKMCRELLLETHTTVLVWSGHQPLRERFKAVVPAPTTLQQ